jgi:spoIIIJ-associated protein
MSEKRTSLEMIANSAEEAIAAGLEELGLTEEDVDVEILDLGSRGLFGLGSRQARVRLTIKSTDSQDKAAVTPIPLPMPMPMPMPVAAPEPIGELNVQFSAPETAEEQQDPVLRVARETVTELLQKMQVKARVSARHTIPDESGSRSGVWVDVRGDDLSILIGPKAETLSAFQYITGLIIAKELGHPISLVVDVQGYRARREQQIRQLARRMADQAIKTGRRQVLEPMPASERRLVHIELRANPEVTTESIGEDPRRKVTIIPKGA